MKKKCPVNGYVYIYVCVWKREKGKRGKERDWELREKERSGEDGREEKKQKLGNVVDGFY